MSSKKFNLLIILLASILIGVTACAPTVRERPKVDLYWPLPPDEPRIKFVDIFRSTLDLGKKRGLAETLFGEEQVEAFDKPYGVAVDKEGKIYVTDIGRVFVIDLKNKDYDFIGVEPGTGRLSLPIGVATASDGRVFVTDTGQSRVFVYFRGKYAAAIGKTGDFSTPSGVALDEKRGFMYIVDARKHQVSVYSLKDYSRLKIIGKRGTGPGEFNYPTNIAVDGDGNVYVVDTGNFRIQVFDPEGAFLRTIGAIGDAPGSLARPKGIAIDSEGHIYVVDAAFQNFQIFDKDGHILLFVGGAGSEVGKFLLPAGIAIDDQDRIYVVDQVTESLQIFQYLGEKWKQRQALEQKEGKPEKARDK